MRILNAGSFKTGKTAWRRQLPALKSGLPTRARIWRDTAPFPDRLTKSAKLLVNKIALSEATHGTVFSKFTHMIITQRPEITVSHDTFTQKQMLFSSYLSEKYPLRPNTPPQKDKNFWIQKQKVVFRKSTGNLLFRKTCHD
ncbi:hypothetical protein GG681_09760 [Epibacterium sp. SM1969]|uniref:Uncharacterized protein n=1 Tax=Tritonibacter aquimaris TaxID=2663379 RepID=A0A844AU57_9RHOB|nr:hypothetical protein [Tritonibacter aquimaris]MQY42928.1 hypothetical protein [Tritonibacter aquimaris]